MKRMITTLALAAAMLLATATAALAFEPPADPAEKFTCEPDGTPLDAIAGFPGVNGQNRAIFGTGNTVGAWNATEDGGSNSGGHAVVTICE